MNLSFALAAFVALAAAGRAAEPTPAAAPALNWVVHVFSDKEGYRVLTARGAEARAQTNDNVLVTNLSITVYTGDATAQVETVFLSPLATFSAKTNRASGDQSVRVVRDDFEATATKWNYDHARKHVTLEGDVRIVINADLPSLLK
jgi:lipopolysaccharide export system protein LptC